MLMVGNAHPTDASEKGTDQRRIWQGSEGTERDAKSEIGGAGRDGGGNLRATGAALGGGPDGWQRPGAGAAAGGGGAAHTPHRVSAQRCILARGEFPAESGPRSR